MQINRDNFLTLVNKKLTARDSDNYHQRELIFIITEFKAGEEAGYPPDRFRMFWRDTSRPSDSWVRCSAWTYAREWNLEVRDESS